ncbi:cytochrome P460 family protein [Ruegeria atlantica]|uniref:cytochrome P460 family protein n=1 Tax=Ruegeria atlantica TaxID=81569 RepID=UPI00147A2895|nr:cytochrome P460 family protein [Ruegeria atlantica]
MFLRFKRVFSISLTVLSISGLSATDGFAQSTGEDAHIAIENPADLSKGEALRIYESLQRRMARGYGAAQLDLLLNYQNWPLFNDAPYISATHGQRYVNSYANRMAHNYGTLAEGEKLPKGSVLAKDSVTVTDEGNIHPGALFVMEKLAQGESPDTGDWRYIMVMPDGSLFGDTMGARANSVAYCHDCHEAVADRDYTFFVPEEYVVDN